jgi:hypothetical protein
MITTPTPRSVKNQAPNSRGKCGCNSTSAWLSGGLSVVGGLAAGAAVMYLLDPDRGGKRHTSLARKVTDTVRGATKAAGSAWEHAGGAKRRLRERLHHGVEAIGERAGRFGGRLAGVGSKATSEVAGLRERIGRLLGIRERREWYHVSGPVELMSAIGLVGLGASLVYFFRSTGGRSAGSD